MKANAVSQCCPGFCSFFALGFQDIWGLCVCFLLPFVFYSYLCPACPLYYSSLFFLFFFCHLISFSLFLFHASSFLPFLYLLYFPLISLSSPFPHSFQILLSVKWSVLFQGTLCVRINKLLAFLLHRA